MLTPSRAALATLLLLGAPLAAARADDWSQTITATRTALASIKHSGTDIDQLEKTPENLQAYTYVIEPLYNHNQRDLALKLLALAQTRVKEPLALTQFRDQIARYELDLPTLEKFYRDQFDAALAAGHAADFRVLGLGRWSSIASDPIFLERVLPAYAARAFDKSPQSASLFNFLRQNTTDPTQCLALIRKRLAAVPDDADAASYFAQLAIETKDFSALIDNVPPIVQKGENFPYYQTRAQLALNRKTDALANLAQAEEQLAAAKFKNSFTWISEFYAAAGHPEQARAVALQYGRPGSPDLLQALVRVADKDNASACLQLILDNPQYNCGPIFDAADAIRPLDPIAADKAFDEAERRMIAQQKRTLNPLFDLSSDIAAHYNGRTTSLYEVLLPLVAGDNAKLRFFLSSFVLPPSQKDRLTELFTLLQRHEKEFPNNWLYQGIMGRQLEQLGRYAQAKAKLVAALALRPANTNTDYSFGEPRLEDGLYNCLMALKDYPACEAFLKDHKVRPLADFYADTNQFDKAIAAYHAEGVYERAYSLIAEKRGMDAAAAYIQTVPAPRRAALEDALMVARGDTASLQKTARARLAATPADADLHAKLALLLFQAHQAPEARREIIQAVDLGASFGLLPDFSADFPDMADSGAAGSVALYQLIPLYDENKVLPHLEADLKPLLTRTNAHRASYLSQLANYYVKAGQKPAAITALQQVATLDPYNAPAHRELIATLQK